MSYDTDLQLFIDGAWKSGEGRDAHPVVNPVTASAIAEVPYATEADLDEALAARKPRLARMAHDRGREARRDSAIRRRRCCASVPTILAPS
jgi:succinate-semialdehyde dehydrogenase/glutarate-semialdehyde dehydrogenase